VISREPAPIPDPAQMAGDRYPQLLRTPQHRWWRPMLGLLIGALAVVVAAVVVILVALAIEAVRGNTANPRDDATLTPDSPLGLLANNLVLATLIPAAVLAVWGAHRAPVGWLASVVGRPRWSVLGRFFLLALAVVMVFFAASFAVPPAGFGDIDPPPAGTLLGLLVVILLTTPLQSAAEEYLFRGYLSQCVAGWVRSPVAGAVLAGVLTAALFSAAHLPGDVPTFLDRFVFGLAASAVVWLTGGLEASIVLHAVNNVLVFVLAGALGSGVATQEVPDGTGLLFLLLSVASVAAYVVVVRRSRHRLRPEMHTAALDLRTPGQPIPVAAG
jgi:uncharacterized protein